MKRIREYKNNKDKNKSEKNNKIRVMYAVKVDLFLSGSHYHDNGQTFLFWAQKNFQEMIGNSFIDGLGWKPLFETRAELL